MDGTRGLSGGIRGCPPRQLRDRVPRSGGRGALLLRPAGACDGRGLAQGAARPQRGGRNVARAACRLRAARAQRWHRSHHRTARRRRALGDCVVERAAAQLRSDGGLIVGPKREQQHSRAFALVPPARGAHSPALGAGPRAGRPAEPAAGAGQVGGRPREWRGRRHRARRHWDRDPCERPAPGRELPSPSSATEERRGRHGVCDHPRGRRARLEERHRNHWRRRTVQCRHRRRRGAAQPDGRKWHRHRDRIRDRSRNRRGGRERAKRGRRGPTAELRQGRRVPRPARRLRHLHGCAIRGVSRRHHELRAVEGAGDQPSSAHCKPRGGRADALRALHLGAGPPR